MNNELLKTLFLAVYNSQLRMITTALKRLPDEYELPDFQGVYNECKEIG